MNKPIESADPPGAKPTPRRDGAMTPGTLRNFVTIAETGSISRAAELLGMAQPTLSIQLASLEQWFGLPLLYRRPKIRLTEPGREFFIRARHALARLDDLESYTRDLRELERGRLTVGTSTPAFAMPLIATFMAHRPAIEIRSTVGNTSNLLDDLSECRVDVAVLTLDEPIARLRCALIAKQRLKVFLPTDHPLAVGRDAIHFAELEQLPLVLRESGSMTRKLVETAYRERSAVLRTRLEVGSREALKEAVAAGIGAGILLEGEVRGDQRVKELALTGTSVSGGVYAVAIKEAVDIPAVHAFVQHAVSAGSLHEKAGSVPGTEGNAQPAS